ncbi:single-strand binding protein [Cutibacterium acnes JCM 18918]|nr:single-strand binding protein [Cutibacterium acnes JCM 18918]
MPATCRRPEKRAEAPLGDDRVVRYHDSPDGSMRMPRWLTTMSRWLLLRSIRPMWE